LNIACASALLDEITTDVNVYFERKPKPASNDD
jgi:hypothetical protein